MNSLLINFVIALWIEALVSLFFGIFLFVKGTEKSHKLYGLHSFSVFLWSFSQIWLISCDKYQTAFFWAHLLLIGVFFISTFFFHFTISFLQIKNKGWAIRLAYLLNIIFIGLSPTKYMVADVVPKFYVKYFAIPGLAYHFLAIFYSICVVYSLRKLFEAYINSSGGRRNQLKYLFWSTFLGFAGGSGNFLLGYDVNVPLLPFLTYLGSLWAGIATYAILRHHLLDINIVIKRTAVYSILVTLITVSYFILIYIVESSFRGFVGYKSISLTIGFLIIFTLLFQPLKNAIQSFIDKYFFKGSQAALADELQKAQEELKRAERLKAVGTLAAGMAHEIKNPLTGIKTFTEYLPEKYTDPKFVEKFHKIVSMEVNKINDIVQQLLDFSKPKPLQLREVNIHQVIDQTLSLLSNSLIKYKIALVRNYDNSLPLLSIDPNQMQQVFCNLFLNAIDAMKEGGQLSVATKANPDYIELTISDTGKGIAKKDLEHIFDPFYTTKDTGTGLGMSIIYGIIKEHKGEIGVESGEIKGTKVTIKIPITQIK
ncbi:MAG: ATP-binding protein [Candidatus Omnitrophica bacterium]|jgi:signal transduction histidine kinase|nr:ATP-binding protein [Candidatus Omnitrophota bacterium]